ncbi:MAG: GTPase ObgE, partial [Lysobacteraceae bacterium]
EAQARADAVIAGLGWDAPWFIVSALSHDGTREVCLKVQQFFDELKYAASQQDSDDAPMTGAPTADV